MGLIRNFLLGSRDKTAKQVTSSTQELNKAKKPSRSNSKSRPRTYKGSSFAQPGEVSELFGYANFKTGKKLNGPYSIIDVETSALSHFQGHIIEIAILQINAKGEKLKEFSTLIRPPDGQVGATDVHGIRRNDIRNAPSFQEVIGNILSICRNSIIVAHNARFEERFLKKEFKRFGYFLPTLPALDTLWLSRQVIDLHNYKLQTVVNGYGHKIVNAHTALGDTRAVAKILPKMLKAVEEVKYPVGHPKLPVKKTTLNLKKR